MSGNFDEDQLQSGDTLDDRGVDDVLDEGMSPPERPSPEVAHAVTPAEDAEDDTLEERMEQEEPDPNAEVDHSADADPEAVLDAEENADPFDGYETGDERTGRLTPDPDDHDDDVADDVGIDGAAASAEEAAVHTLPEDER